MRQRLPVITSTAETNEQTKVRVVVPLEVPHDTRICIEDLVDIDELRERKENSQGMGPKNPRRKQPGFGTQGPLKKKEHTQPQGDKERESDAKLDQNHEHSSGMQESIEAEGTEERVLTSHTEMCEVCEVASVEEGHDFERDEVHRALKSALEAQVIVCSDEWLSVFSDYVGSGVGPTIKYAEGGAE